MKHQILVVLLLLSLVPTMAMAQSDGEHDNTSGIHLELSDGQSVGPVLLFSDVIATVPTVSNAPVPSHSERFATGRVHFEQAGNYELVIDFFKVGESFDQPSRTSGQLDGVRATGDCRSNVARREGLNAIITMKCPGSVAFHFFTNTHYIVLLVFESPLPIPATASEGSEG